MPAGMSVIYFYSSYHENENETSGFVVLLFFLSFQHLKMTLQRPERNLIPNTNPLQIHYFDGCLQVSL